MPSDRQLNWGLLVLRLGLAFAVLSYGVSKLVTWDRSIGFFRAMSFPAPTITAPLNMALEVVAGLLLLAGVRVRTAAALVIVDFVFIVPANVFTENLNFDFLQFTVARVAPAIAAIILGGGGFTLQRLSPERRGHP